MLKMPDTKSRFFSVRHGTKIQGVLYTPSVCYPLSAGLQAVVEEMAAKDMARIYPEKVRFVTGIPYPVKKPETGRDAPRSSSASAPDTKTSEIPAVSERSGRKSGRRASTTQVNRAFD
jgi:hypothetical protein